VLLYNSAVSGNCYKVRLLLAQLGLEYETVEMSVVDRSNRAEVFGDPNPAREVERHPLVLRRRNSFRPRGPYERAQVLQWQVFEQN
jgi:glutathione S-transferase